MISQAACPGSSLEEHRVRTGSKSEARFHDQKGPKTADKVVSPSSTKRIKAR